MNSMWYCKTVMNNKEYHLHNLNKDSKLSAIVMFNTNTNNHYYR